LDILTNPGTTFNYELMLSKDLQMPVYKERAFSLDANIVDRNLRFAPLADPCDFKIMLFTTEVPPKVMKINTSGDKIMRGTTEISLARNTYKVNFSKIVIKEVTSHFRNGCFFLVVLPSNPEIKPLIIENLVIKARKMCAEPKVRKKRKTEDNEDSPDPASSSQQPKTEEADS
jgi:hypothetical protein